MDRVSPPQRPTLNMALLSSPRASPPSPSSIPSSPPPASRSQPAGRTSGQRREEAGPPGCLECGGQGRGSRRPCDSPSSPLPPQPSPQPPAFDFSSQVTTDVLGEMGASCASIAFFFYSLPFPFSDRGLQSSPEGDAHLILEASPQHWGHCPPAVGWASRGRGTGVGEHSTVEKSRLGSRFSPGPWVFWLGNWSTRLKFLWAAAEGGESPGGHVCKAPSPGPATEPTCGGKVLDVNSPHRAETSSSTPSPTPRPKPGSGCAQ